MTTHYIPNSDVEIEQMLRDIGVGTFEDLIRAIPQSLRLRQPLDLPPPLSEPELVRHMTELAQSNWRFKACFAGGGAYDHFVPAVIWRLASRSEFITAYTPYQAEVAQGTLQATYEFQSMVSRLCGLPVTNASMYDGASALAEAALLAWRHTGRDVVLLASTMNPSHVQVIRTYLAGTGVKIRLVPMRDGVIDHDSLRDLLGERVAALVVQSPNFLGIIEEIDDLARDVKDCGALLVMSYDPISLGILKTPGDYGADIACAEGQPLGLPLSFGGPYLGLFSVRADLVRKMPGRLVARTVDSRGNTGYVLTLQTREQHIKRERATSNICTNQQLCALAATIYLAIMGKHGIRRVAELCLQRAHYAAEKIASLNGYALKYKRPFFKEFVVQTPVPPRRIIARLARQGILAGIDLGAFRIGLKGCLLVAVTEKISPDQIDEFVSWLSRMK